MVAGRLGAAPAARRRPGGIGGAQDQLGPGAAGPAADGMDAHPQRPRCAIVTGAGHGLGRAFAARLAADGAQVVGAELDAHAGRAVARELAAQGGEAVTLATAVADPAGVERMAAGAVAAFGRIDVLVNHAAVFQAVPLLQGAFETIPIAHREQVFRVDVIGTWRCCRAVVPEMRRLADGKIITLGSAAVFTGAAPSPLQYLTAKSAVVGFTRSLARALGPDGIRVNCVAPGRTASDAGGADRPDAQAPARLRERAITRVELPADVVGAISFLAGPDSDVITGQTWVVDGGAAMP